MSAVAVPVRVSPLIKLTRYSALVLGITYGISRKSSLTKKEDARREKEAKEAVVRDALLAEQKKKLDREQLLYMAKEAGVPVPDDF